MNYIGVDKMKLRKKEYGDANIIGKNVERLQKSNGYKQKDFISKLQVMELYINPTSYSKNKRKRELKNQLSLHFIKSV